MSPASRASHTPKVGGGERDLHGPISFGICRTLLELPIYSYVGKSKYLLRISWQATGVVFSGLSARCGHPAEGAGRSPQIHAPQKVTGDLANF